MTDQRAGVVAGVDAHTDEHHVAVVDVQGRLLGAAAFPTTAEGYARLIGWLRGQGKIDLVGVESTGAYAAGLVRALLANARRIRELEREILELDNQLERLVNTAAPRKVELFGVGTQGASQLLVTAGQNIDRLRNEAAFAKICGAAPIQASSGRTTRHRLEPRRRPTSQPSTAHDRRLPPAPLPAHPDLRGQTHRPRAKPA